jgi:hypothetical protein
MRGDSQDPVQPHEIFRRTVSDGSVAIAMSIFDRLATLEKVSRAEFDGWTYPPRKADSFGNETPPDEHDMRCRRADVAAENKRRLRTTMWAEVTLRGTKHQSFADMLGSFHREHWRIARVSDDSAERERQIVDAVRP